MSGGDDLARVAWRFPEPLIPGRLVRRYKRFLAEVELDDGHRVTAHCPNSGSMLGCLAEAAPVYLSHHSDPKRRTAHTWEMIRINGSWVGINTGLPNKLVAEAARQRVLPPFADALSVRPEVPLGPGTRLDLLVQRDRGPLYVEVKNVTLVEGRQARFPDAVTTRGAKHLRELTALTARGQAAAMIYLVQRQDAQAFRPARDIDPVYARELERALAAGVEAWVVQARVSPRGVSLWRTLPLELGG